MTYIILPNTVRDAINSKIDAFLAQHPDLEAQRDNIYNDLLAAYVEYGEIADLGRPE